jgi:glycerol kinase
MAERAILVLDEGTTSTRAMLFTPEGRMTASAQAQLDQHYPRDGYVEHDAAQIWERTLSCARQMVEKAGGADRVAAIGITNQRETVVAWDKASGQPLARAIVWQDRRTAPICAAMKEAGHEDAVRAKTGLLLDPYFSATKMRWLMDNDGQVRAAARSGRLAFGTVESWLVHRLSGGAHVSDASNASRTALMPLEGNDWDADLCELFGVPRETLPEITDNAGEIALCDPQWFGRAIPICGMAGDQQAATLGQHCLSPGETKATYGTGAFVLANTGGAPHASDHRLLTTVLWQIGGQRTFALEGSVFVAGSLVQWLRDALGVISSAAETEALARSVPDTGGVAIVPALSGLGAPHWQPDARGSITGLSFATTRAHIARAALEAMAHQTDDLARAFASDGAAWSTLRIDGGMAANDWMAADIAGLIDLEVQRPQFVETTALGAGMLAAYGAGLHPTLEAAADAMRSDVERFDPAMDNADRDARRRRWQRALETARI